MLKLIIATAPTRWSMRGWLALKQPARNSRSCRADVRRRVGKAREGDEFAPSLGKVPILWTASASSGDSLRSSNSRDRVGRERSGPKRRGRGMARSMAAECTPASPPAPRVAMTCARACAARLSDGVKDDITAFWQLWRRPARASEAPAISCWQWCAADIMYAPASPASYLRGTCAAVRPPLHEGGAVHPHVQEWIDQAQDEPWVTRIMRRPTLVRRAVLVNVAASAVNSMSMSE